MKQCVFMDKGMTFWTLKEILKSLCSFKSYRWLKWINLLDGLFFIIFYFIVFFWFCLAPEISLPVITNVQSLATTNGTPVTTRSTRSKSANTPSSNTTASPAVKTQIKQQIIIRPNRLPAQRNIATMCKVVQASKGVSCHPITAHKATQTGKVICCWKSKTNAKFYNLRRCCFI